MNKLSGTNLVQTNRTYTACVAEQFGNRTVTRGHITSIYDSNDVKIAEVVCGPYPGPEYGTWHYVHEDHLQHEFTIQRYRDRIGYTDLHFIHASMRAKKVDSGVPPWLIDACQKFIDENVPIDSVDIYSVRIPTFKEVITSGV